jgi:hypothetical protein
MAFQEKKFPHFQPKFNLHFQVLIFSWTNKISYIMHDKLQEIIPLLKGNRGNKKALLESKSWIGSSTNWEEKFLMSQSVFFNSTYLLSFE